MTDSDMKMFNTSLDHLTDTLRVEQLSRTVKRQYWNALERYTADQFIAACTQISVGYRKKHSNDFPLPADFIDAMPAPASTSNEQNIREGNVGVAFEVLMPKLLALFEKHKKRSDIKPITEALQAIVDKEFEGLPVSKPFCQHCLDVGYVYVWFQFAKGLRRGKSGEYESRRVPNSPCYVTPLDSPSPNPDINLAKTIARCECSIGKNQEQGVPLANAYA
jgi:hypothetical protein